MNTHAIYFLVAAAVTKSNGFLSPFFFTHSDSFRTSHFNRLSHSISYSNPLKNSLLNIPEEQLDDIFSFTDPKTLKYIDCYVEHIAVVDSKRYFVGYPVDDAVAVTIDDDGDLVPLPVEDELLKSVVPNFQEDFEKSESGLVLKHTPVVLTLSGLNDEDDDEFEDDENDSEEDAVDNDDNEDVELISELEINEVKFQLVKFLDPIWIVAREIVSQENDNDIQYYLLDGDEDEKVSGVVEQLLSETPIDE